MQETVTEDTPLPPRGDCPGDCPCRRYTYTEVVPHQPDKHDVTDEVLLGAWSAWDCLQCLTWWIERAMCDPRYDNIVASVQRQWRTVNVDELRQEVALAVWKWPGAIGSPSGFFRKLLWRAAYHAHYSRPDEAPLPPDPQPTSLSRASDLTEAKVQAMRDCVQKLPPPDKALTRAFYYEGVSLIEFAKLVGKSYSAITQQIARARLKLRRCMDGVE